MSEVTVTRLRRKGLLSVRLQGIPNYSRSDVEEFLSNPFLNGRQAAMVLGVSHAGVSQLAKAEKIPCYVTPSGVRYYRQGPLKVVARARRLKGTDLTGPDTDTWIPQARNVRWPSV